MAVWQARMTALLAHSSRKTTLQRRRKMRSRYVFCTVLFACL